MGSASDYSNGCSSVTADLQLEDQQHLPLDGSENTIPNGHGEMDDDDDDGRSDCETNGRDEKKPMEDGDEASQIDGEKSNDDGSVVDMAPDQEGTPPSGSVRVLKGILKKSSSSLSESNSTSFHVGVSSSASASMIKRVQWVEPARLVQVHEDQNSEIDYQNKELKNCICVIS